MSHAVVGRLMKSHVHHSMPLGLLYLIGCLHISGLACWPLPMQCMVQRDVGFVAFAQTLEHVDVRRTAAVLLATACIWQQQLVALEAQAAVQPQSSLGGCTL
jgi:hypothetical protein